jgi:3-keto-5-aminohexanoate cleavage enzyme
MAHKVWLEVALNGSWGRQLQPKIPITVEELIDDGISCARAGAAIIHVHTYDPRSGKPKADADAFARVSNAIRAKYDVIVYPTIESERAGTSELSSVGPRRYAVVETLAQRELLEWAAVDPGSVNITAYAALANPDPHAGLVYLNPESDIRTGLALCAKHDLYPTYAIYEPGFLRLGAAMAARTPHLRTPIYRLMFSDGMTFGMPPRDYALSTYRSLLAEYAPGAPWMIAGYSVDLTSLIPEVVANNGHVRVGLEDAPLGSERSNRQWVSHAADAIRKAGGELATAADIRQALAARAFD